VIESRFRRAKCSVDGLGCKLSLLHNIKMGKEVAAKKQVSAGQPVR
jgi:hypothetical protein